MIRSVTLTDFFPESILMAMDPKVLDQVVLSVMAGARDFWIKEASLLLRSSRRDYINSIQEVEFQNGRASVALVGALALMVENGIGPFDMHDTLLGPNVPTVPVGQRGKHARSGGGFYRSVPFRHQTPASVGQGGGAPMGSQFPDIPGLGKSIHKAAKQLAPTMSLPGGPTQWGGRLPAGGAPLLRPHHATDIYAGMYRVQKTYKKATQSTYVTFRTISTAVPDKWQHPGIEAANIMASVEKHVEKTAIHAVIQLVENAL